MDEYNTFVWRLVMEELMGNMGQIEEQILYEHKMLTFMVNNL